jgi:uncharacterized Zn-finger protein
MADPYTVEVTEFDSFLCCPPTDDMVWNQHPRVFLEVRQTGEATCPYCRTHYVFKAQAAGDRPGC